MSAAPSRLLCGRHAVTAALAAGTARQLWLTTDTNRDLLATAQAAGVTVTACTTGRLDRLAGTTSHQGVVALCVVAPKASWQEAISVADNPLLVVLDQVQDPRNLGACVRTCAAMGVQAIIYPKRRSAAFTPAASHAAQGGDQFVTIEAVPNLARELDLLRAAGFTVIGATAEAKCSINDLAIAGPAALVLGGEHAGLRRLTRAKCDVLAAIDLPSIGKVAHLNVSVACGICLAALNRCRKTGCS